MCADKPLRHFSKKYTGGSYRDRTCAPGVTRLAGFQDRGIATLPNFLKLKNILVPQAGVEPACPKALASKASVSTGFTTGAEILVLKERLELSENLLLRQVRLPIPPLEQLTEKHGVPIRSRTGMPEGDGF